MKQNKTLSQLEKEKVEIESQIEELKNKVNSEETMIIPKIGTVTRIKDWDKPYNQIVCPKDFRLIKVWELQYILDSKYSDEFLGDYKGKWNYFWCNQTKFDKLNNHSSRLILNRYLSVYSYWYNLDNSSENGRVVFIKEVKHGK